MRKAEAGHFGGIANKELAVCDSGYVPCAVIEGLEASDFTKGIWFGIDEGDSAVFRLDEEFVVPEEDVSKAITTAFPESLSGP